MSLLKKLLFYSARAMPKMNSEGKKQELRVNLPLIPAFFPPELNIRPIYKFKKVR
jgi:hypothetical protein